MDNLWPGGKRIAVVFNMCLEAWSDGPQSLTPAGFAEIMAELQGYVALESRYLN